MEKICLIKAGNYFLAIDTERILSTVHVDDLDSKDSDIPCIVHLASFFAGQELPVSGHEIILFESENETDPPAFLVDRIVDTLAAPTQFESLPLLYPTSAKQCCPRIFIANDTPVMLLDTDAFLEFFSDSGNEVQRISLDVLPEVLVENDESTDVPLADPMSHEQEAESTFIVEQATGRHGEDQEGSIEEIISERDPLLADLPESGEDISIQPETKDTRTESSHSAPEAEQKPVIEADEEAAPGSSADPFDNLVFWIIAQYLKREGDENVVIEAKDLPDRLLEKVSLTEDELLYLITKTIRKCNTTDNTSLRQMIEKRES